MVELKKSECSTNNFIAQNDTFPEILTFPSSLNNNNKQLPVNEGTDGKALV